MTTKGLVRYVVAVIILMVILSIGLPLGGIPRQVIWAPPLAYLQAGSSTTGYVTDKDTSPTANPFHVGDKDYFVWYQYRAPKLPGLGKHGVGVGVTDVYKGHAQVLDSLYNSAKVGDTVTVKFDPGDPIISGITGPGGGRNGDGQASIISQWVLWDIGILAIAYPLAMLLERVMLRESY